MIAHALVGMTPRGNTSTKVGNMRSLNTKLALSALGVALLATPSFADNLYRQPSDQTKQFQGRSIDEVVVDGQVIGADPDPRIRGELSRDYGSSEGN
jgi:hypothetical protein